MENWQTLVFNGRQGKKDPQRLTGDQRKRVGIKEAKRRRNAKNSIKAIEILLYMITNKMGFKKLNYFIDSRFCILQK